MSIFTCLHYHQLQHWRSASPDYSSNLHCTVRVPSFYTKGLLWKPSSLLSPPVTPFLPVLQTYTAQLTDTLAKITQLQRLPQVTPDVFEGNDSDKTKFSLWENAFESLIDSAPVTARQKLHLLYQYLGGKAKKVVEQL